MDRIIEGKLKEWKERKVRKPLLINGIRQVGKTWSIKDFGKKYFDDFIYINFDIDPSYGDIFKKSKDPKKILFELSVLFEKKIDPFHTLIFFDEIQECNDALNSLKYFCEDPLEYYIVGAGSYLGITLSKGASFPVGKVDMIELKPMTFKEFLNASGQNMLVKYLESLTTIEPLPEPIFNKLNEYLREYYLTGGMPEAVKIWIENRDFRSLDQTLENIINAYYRDFSKYPPSSMMPKIGALWNSIVAQLSRETKKFKYSDISKNARAREYESALEWLISGNYLIKTNMVNKYQLPLKGYESISNFKVYMRDVGLLRKMANFPIGSLLDLTGGENIPFKGAMTENYVLQELDAILGEELFYWNKNNYEIDFLLQWHDFIIPIEVKAGVNVKSACMKKILEDLDLGIRFSMKNLSHDGKIINIPLALAGELLRILELL